MEHDQPEPCIIACGILKEEINQLLSQEKIQAKPHYLNSKLHYNYGLLEQALRAAIEKQGRQYDDRIIVVYGDVCLGFDQEMKRLVKEYGLVKVDALNCIDCQLGGRNRLLEIDPDHKFLFLNQAFINFFQDGTTFKKDPAEVQELFSVLTGIILIDPLGDLDNHLDEIEHISSVTGLPVLDRLNVGLDGLEKLLIEAAGRLNSRAS